MQSCNSSYQQFAENYIQKYIYNEREKEKNYNNVFATLRVSRISQSLGKKNEVIINVITT